MASHSAAHRHLFASKLRELFSTSPFVFVYQTLGNIRSTVLTTGMQKELEKQLPASGVTAACFRTKNTVATASDSCINPFFLASNLVVGWQLAQDGQPLLSAGPAADLSSDGSSSSSSSNHSPSSSAKPAAHGPEIRARYGNSLQELLGDLSHAPGLPDRIPHTTLSTLIRLSLQLPDRHPVALLACFYRGSHVGLGDLRRWAKLNETQVYSELLHELDGGPAGLVDMMEANTDSLMQMLDAAGPSDLLSYLDMHVHANTSSDPTSPATT
ncbi:MAG: hypothetical protein WDW38_011603 [Sanguina aurantia]